ncbi:site-specific integrase [Paracoccus sp. SCSIO 75233]|uniref:tyrosine-type recombinase/integrase n=1 Tax=Paracoccus sp. SCSIO 75233 TaxID=3017782 RepID=UPI0022F11B1F|nr:site-specific integrase [Paracoccus sp. SCSIO 75233]WBU53019.1 tyrosine-type recombinase/integrase [Paracoccus sp. SCSIO 75233]
MFRVRLTERSVKAAQPRSKDYEIFDSEALGMAIRIYASGNRAFTFAYRHHGRQRRFTLGRWPEWSVTAARDRVRDLRRQLDAGIDPLEERETARTAPRISDLVTRFIEEHLPSLAARNASDQKSMLEQFVLPVWRNRLVSEITPTDVDTLLRSVAQGRARKRKTPKKGEAAPRPTPVRANRCGEMLRKMFNLAIKWKMITENPAQHFFKRPETERDRFLSPDELSALATALSATEDRRSAAIVRMCLLTGARLGEVREARFEDFDLDNAAWTKQAAYTKQRRVHRVPLSLDAVALIRARQEELGIRKGWVFPGDAPDKPVQDLRRFWHRTLREAGLEDIRLHDLRHTFASLLINRGSSLEMIGALLGHTQAKTTKRYAHLMDSPLREGVNDVAGFLRPRLRVVD